MNKIFTKYKTRTLFLLCITLVFVSFAGCGSSADKTQKLSARETADYYDTFSTLANEECINEMQANRIPLKYDKKTETEGIKTKVTGMGFTSSDSGTWDFSAEVSLEQSGKTSENAKITGQITVDDESRLVSSVFISNVVNSN